MNDFENAIEKTAMFIVRDIDALEKKIGAKSWKQIALNARGLLSIALEMRPKNSICTWVERASDVGEVWASECGETSVYASPTDGNFSYCPFCGKPIETEEHWGEEL